MIEKLGFSRLEQEDIYSFLEVCESFGSNNLSGFGVVVSFQGRGLTADRVTVSDESGFIFHMEYPYAEVFRIIEGTRVFLVNAIDNNNVNIFD